MKTSQGTGVKAAQVGSRLRLKSPETTMVSPFQRTTAWAEPSTWPAGTRVTSTSSRRTASP